MFISVIVAVVCVSLQHGFGQPHDVAVSGDGEAVYVAEIGPNRVWKFAQHKCEQVGHNQMVNIQRISFIGVCVPDAIVCHLCLPAACWSPLLLVCVA